MTLSKRRSQASLLTAAMSGLSRVCRKYDAWRGCRYQSSAAQPRRPDAVVGATQAAKHGQTFDVLIIGGGHNGLVAAAYLAKQDLKVAVLERRSVLGGAAVTEELIPGYKFSRASYLLSLFRPHIVADLKLHDHGFKTVKRNPSSFTPLAARKEYLMLGDDPNFSAEQIAKFSKRDAEEFPRFMTRLSRLVAALEPLMDESPLGAGVGPTSAAAFGVKERLKSAMNVGRLGGRLMNLGADGIAELTELFTAPAEKILRRTFESEPLRCTLSTDAIIGSMTSPSQPGSGYVLLHHLLGGSWSYVQGGMGALSSAIASSARQAGATLFVDTPVSRVLVEGQGESGARVAGVQLDDGRQLYARTVLSNADPKRTFLGMCSEAPLPASFLDRVRSMDFRSPTVKINVALKGLPSFWCMSRSPPVTPGPEHFGTIHLGAETLEDINAAYFDALVNERPSSRPIIEMSIPSAVDPTVAPKGHAVAGLFVQYASYDLPWDSPGYKDAFVKRVFSLVDGYAPGFSDLVVGYDALSPRDLEREFALTSGNIFHGSMTLDQMYHMRPVSGAAGYRTPLRGLYLCGAGSHPGGGVCGAAGRNCSQVVLQDLRSLSEGDKVLSLMRSARGRETRTETV